MLMMFRALWASPQRTKILLLGVAIVPVVSVTVFCHVRINAWSRDFFNAIEHKNFLEFIHQLVVFVVVAGGLWVLNVVLEWLSQMTKIILREGLVRDLFQEWLKPRRAFHLTYADKIGAHPADRRIVDGTRQLAERSVDLGIGLLKSSLLLGSFIGVLWFLSRHVTFHVNGHTFVIRGYMLWCALLYAGTASWLGWRVGRPLIDRNAERDAREGDLRFALVRLNEHTDSVTIHAGEWDENWRLSILLNHIVGAMRRSAGMSTRLTWITTGYSLSTLIVPTLFAAPAYFGGGLSFGALMMAVNAFKQLKEGPGVVCR
jgi:vitamin B12/bleomycin/antimicrobial peptide transport system ATP-binding/permease protein